MYTRIDELPTVVRNSYATPDQIKWMNTYNHYIDDGYTAEDATLYAWDECKFAPSSRYFQAQVTTEVIDRDGDLVPVDDAYQRIQELIFHGGFGHSAHSSKYTWVIWDVTKEDKLDAGHPAVTVRGNWFRGWPAADQGWNHVITGKEAEFSIGAMFTKKLECTETECHNIATPVDVFEISTTRQGRNPYTGIVDIHIPAEDCEDHQELKLKMAVKGEHIVCPYREHYHEFKVSASNKGLTTSWIDGCIVVEGQDLASPDAQELIRSYYKGSYIAPANDKEQIIVVRPYDVIVKGECPEGQHKHPGIEGCHDINQVHDETLHTPSSDKLDMSNENGGTVDVENASTEQLKKVVKAIAEAIIGYSDDEADRFLTSSAGKLFALAVIELKRRKLKTRESENMTDTEDVPAITPTETTKGEADAVSTTETQEAPVENVEEVKGDMVGIGGGIPSGSADPIGDLAALTSAFISLKAEVEAIATMIKSIKQESAMGSGQSKSIQDAVGEALSGVVDEDKAEDKVEDKVEEQDPPVPAEPEPKAEDKAEDKPDEKVEEKVEDKVEEKTEDAKPDFIKEKKEETTESKKGEEEPVVIEDAPVKVEVEGKGEECAPETVEVEEDKGHGDKPEEAPVEVESVEPAPEVVESAPVEADDKGLNACMVNLPPEDRQKELDEMKDIENGDKGGEPAPVAPIDETMSIVKGVQEPTQDPAVEQSITEQFKGMSDADKTLAQYAICKGYTIQTKGLPGRMDYERQILATAGMSVVQPATIYKGAVGSIGAGANEGSIRTCEDLVQLLLQGSDASMKKLNEYQSAIRCNVTEK